MGVTLGERPARTRIYIDRRLKLSRNRVRTGAEFGAEFGAEHDCNVATHNISVVARRSVAQPMPTHATHEKKAIRMGR